MNKNIAIVTFTEFDNLGTGYLASVLSEYDFDVTILDLGAGKEDLLESLVKLQPLITGFSVIFEFHFHEFAELTSYLRDNGVNCHFTAGGHYASLCYDELFALIPSLDSIVRFDGEYTFLELAQCISEGREWKKIKGIATNLNGTVLLNPLRTIERDLDKIPYPDRAPLREYVPGKKFATLIAGRGCVNNCIFCSIREYYSQSSGPLKRIRTPETVAAEMDYLYSEHDCSVFLFQDDDFPVQTSRGSEWIERFCSALDSKDLTDKIIWKINCRPDEVSPERFTMMRDHGLFLVFLGIEAGTESGLKNMNKRMTLAESRNGIRIIKNLGLGLDYGFMPFEPSSTLQSVKENFAFLREIFEDGYSPALFAKMMPLSGTLIKKYLTNSGRLKGKPGFYDYDFNDKSLNYFYDTITAWFNKWQYDPHGLANNLKWARNFITVLIRFYGINNELGKIKEDLSKLTAESNIYLLDMLNSLILQIEKGDIRKMPDREKIIYSENIKTCHEDFNRRINEILRKLMILSEFMRQTAQFSSIFGWNL